MHPLSNLAYASWIASRIAYYPCIILFDPCTWLIVSLLLVCLVWVEPGDEFANEEPVEFALEDPVNSDSCAGKMIIPSKSLLSLLCQMLALLLCLCYDAYHLLIMPPKLPCQTSNPPCPSKPLIGYVTALLSPSYSVASCRWRLEAVPCWNIYLLVGISLYYLVILMHLYTW